jgi:hypothetical protein
MPGSQRILGWNGRPTSARGGGLSREPARCLTGEGLAARKSGFSKPAMRQGFHRATSLASARTASQAQTVRAATIARARSAKVTR